MKVLVTGATGSFGAPLVRALVADGVKVHAMARRRPARLPDGVKFIAADIQDSAAVDAAVASVDRVAHLAWLVGIPKDPKDAEAINLTGTHNLLAAMKRHGTERLVFASSVLAYGADPKHGRYHEDEDLRPDPRLLYAHHKKLIEADLVNSSIPTLIVRPAIVAGRYVTPNSVGILATPRLVGVRGEKQNMQFVHQDDVVRFLAKALQDDRTGVVNLASEESIPLSRQGELLGRKVLRLPAPALAMGLDALHRMGLSEADRIGLETLRAWPIADTERSRTKWEFELAWSGEETLIDTRRTLAAAYALGERTFPRPIASRLPAVGGDPTAASLPRPAVIDAVVSGLKLDDAEAPFMQDVLHRGSSRLERGRGGATRLAASWATTEVPIVLSYLNTDGASRIRLSSRVAQLRDLLVDLITLANNVDSSDRRSDVLLESVHTVGERLRSVAEALGGDMWAGSTAETISRSA